MMKIIIFFLICFCLLLTIPQKNIQPMTKQQPYTTVTILGEVKEPKVIKVPLKAKIKDVLKHVELTQEASLDTLDMNKPITADEVIRILPKSKKACISINTATQSELIQIHGIGNSTALKIIHYREENGPFKLLTDLLEVKGIGESKFNKIKDQICL